ncbi:MAG: DUF928 domain-containing protein [Leptolyngbyaceae cyanobacterium bins.59]|nr:DUF928 domain-containing protein [Leptolyngbyaceae cyanobacterium bins.59]
MSLLTSVRMLSATAIVAISLVDNPVMAIPPLVASSQINSWDGFPPIVSGVLKRSGLLSSNPPSGSGRGEGTPKTGGNPPGTRPGGVSCRQTSPPLTALVQDRGEDFTDRSHPTFWVYIPYAADEIKSLEFSLHFTDRLTNRPKTLYRTGIHLTDQPGLIELSLPTDNSGLQVGELYNWKLSIQCKSDTNSASIVYEYWVKRVAQSDQSAWYEKVSALATQMQNGAADVNVNPKWKALLQEQGWENLLQIPFTTYELQPTD